MKSLSVADSYFLPKAHEKSRGKINKERIGFYLINMCADVLSIIGIVFSFLLGVPAIVISLYSLKKTNENSLPVIKAVPKFIKKGRIMKLRIKNIGKTNAYGLIISIRPGWGEANPTRVQIEELEPNYIETCDITMPDDKKGAVYTLELIIRCKKKNFCGKKKQLREQKESFELDKETLFSDSWHGWLD